MLNTEILKFIIDLEKKSNKLTKHCFRKFGGLVEDNFMISERVTFKGEARGLPLLGLPGERERKN